MMTDRSLRYRVEYPLVVGSMRKGQLDAMAQEATVDCDNEAEQLTGFFTMIDENLAVPFETRVLGVHTIVERLDLDDDGQIVAMCRRGKHRQSIPILALRLPTPPPAGAEWIDVYRHWLG